MRLNPIDALRARVTELESEVRQLRDAAECCPGEHTHTTTLDEAQMRGWLRAELIALGLIRVVTPKGLTEEGSNDEK